MWSNQKGFALVEVLVSIFILSLIAGPFISMSTFALQEYREARERTKMTYALQGLLEPVLDPAGILPASTQEFNPHPHYSYYEYRITVRPRYGASLNEVTLELRAKDKPDQVTTLTTLKARRKLYVDGA